MADTWKAQLKRALWKQSGKVFKVTIGESPASSSAPRTEKRLMPSVVRPRSTQGALIEIPGDSEIDRQVRPWWPRARQRTSLRPRLDRVEWDHSPNTGKAIQFRIRAYPNVAFQHDWHIHGESTVICCPYNSSISNSLYKRILRVALPCFWRRSGQSIRSNSSGLKLCEYLLFLGAKGLMINFSK